jgi:hypothetical protein
MINHKAIRPLVAVAIGLVLALYSYQRVTDPEPGLQKAREEGIVMVARDILQSYVSPGNPIEIVDALSPASKVGKVYIYPTDDGWELSGHYRRDERGSNRWRFRTAMIALSVCPHRTPNSPPYRHRHENERSIRQPRRSSSSSASLIFSSQSGYPTPLSCFALTVRT